MNKHTEAAKVLVKNIDYDLLTEVVRLTLVDDYALAGETEDKISISDVIKYYSTEQQWLDFISEEG